MDLLFFVLLARGMSQCIFQPLQTHGDGFQEEALMPVFNPLEIMGADRTFTSMHAAVEGPPQVQPGTSQDIFFCPSGPSDEGRGYDGLASQSSACGLVSSAGRAQTERPASLRGAEQTDMSASRTTTKRHAKAGAASTHVARKTRQHVLERARSKRAKKEAQVSLNELSGLVEAALETCSTSAHQRGAHKFRKTLKQMQRVGRDSDSTNFTLKRARTLKKRCLKTLAAAGRKQRAASKRGAGWELSDSTMCAIAKSYIAGASTLSGTGRSYNCSRDSVRASLALVCNAGREADVLFAKRLAEELQASTQKLAMVIFTWAYDEQEINVRRLTKACLRPDRDKENKSAETSSTTRMIQDKVQNCVSRVFVTWAFEDGEAGGHEFQLPPLRLYSTCAEALWYAMRDHKLSEHVNQ